MTLDEYMASDDDNFFWRLSSGEQKNLLDEAVEHMAVLLDVKGGALRDSARIDWMQKTCATPYYLPDSVFLEPQDMSQIGNEPEGATLREAIDEAMKENTELIKSHHCKMGMLDVTYSRCMMDHAACRRSRCDHWEGSQ